MIILAATNRPWDLDEAILRRLSKRIYIPLPDESARRSLFKLKFGDHKLSENIDWDWLVKQTKYFNSDDITNICREASLVPFNEEIEKLDDLSEEKLEEL